MTGDDRITIERGVDFDAVLEVFEDDEQTARTPLDGWTVVFQARRRRSAETLMLDLSSDDGTGRLAIEDAATEPPGQQIRIHLDAAETAAIPSSGLWALARVDPTYHDNVNSLGNGSLQLLGRIVEVAP